MEQMVAPSTGNSRSNKPLQSGVEGVSIKKLRILEALRDEGKTGRLRKVLSEMNDETREALVGKLGIEM